MASDSLPPLGDLDRALMRVLDRARADTGAARASLFLRDPGSGDAVTRVAHLPERREIRVPAGQGIVGRVIDAKASMVWPTADLSFAPHPEVAAALGYRPERIVAVPVWVDGMVVGALQLLDGPAGADGLERSEKAALRIGQILTESSLASQLRPRGEQPVPLEYDFDGVIGASAPMKVAFGLAGRVSGTDASVLITGETGTGKELFARAIHANSKREGGPFVKIDCGSIPDTLIENELFGHERGAFTGAENPAPGRLEESNHGTLFLDEVGELSPLAQTRLLRVIEEGVVQRLGGGAPKRISFRLLSATHRDLHQLARDGRFREDLVHRLKVVSIRLPALRERGTEDVLRLVEHFVVVHGKRHQRVIRRIPRATQDLLAAYAWRGNVRELSHAVEAAVVLSPNGELSADLFELEAGPPRAASPSGLFADLPTMDELERRYIAHLLQVSGGQKLEVARIAGISRSTLWRRLKEMGVSTDE